MGVSGYLRHARRCGCSPCSVSAGTAVELLDYGIDPLTPDPELINMLAVAALLKGVFGHSASALMRGTTARRCLHSVHASCQLFKALGNKVLKAIKMAAMAWAPF